MSNPNDKALFEGFGDVDWDSALDEWDKNIFVPEVARDAETNRVASSPDPTEALKEKSPAVGTAAAPPVVPTPSLTNASSEGTVIAPVPTELSDDRRKRTPPPPSVRPPLAPPANPRASAPPTTRGGLSQLFSRSSPPPARSRVSVPFEPLEPIEPPDDAVTHALGFPENEASTSTGLRLDDHPSLAQTRAVDAVSPDDALPSTTMGDGEQQAATRQTAVEPSELDDYGAEDDSKLLGEDADDAESHAPAPPKADADDEWEGETVARNEISADAIEQALRPRHDSISDAETQTRLDDEPETLDGRSALPPPVAAPAPPPRRVYSAPPARLPFEGERATSQWVDEQASNELRSRAEWLEEEARSLVDASEQGRSLLSVSELYALLGDTRHALALAMEARTLAPHLPIAWSQARQLLTGDPDAVVEALEAEISHAPTPASRAHAALLSADWLRVSGRGDAAVEHWGRAYKLEPADVRAPASRAALALAHDNHSTAGAELAENSELFTLDKAVATALRLRGAPRAGADVEPMPINDGLRKLRAAIEAQDVVTATQAAAEIGADPALAKASLWLSAAIGATHIGARRKSASALKTLLNDGELAARRQLAARGIELGDPELVTLALASADDALSSAEQAALLAFAGQEVAPILEDLERPLPPALLDGLSATLVPSSEDESVARARRAAGTIEARALAGLGRVLAGSPTPERLDAALAFVAEPRSPSASGVALEAAVRSRRWDELSHVLSTLPTGDDPAALAARYVGAAIVAERAGSRQSAVSAWNEALANGIASDGVVRAIAKLDPGTDLGKALLRVAEAMPDGPASAILRLEAVARGGVDDADAGPLLERVHRGAESLGVAAFLAEHVARRRGDLDDVLRWIQERRAYATDPFETALDAVREALLVADRDPDLASTRLDEAHRARPEDMALRELYERLATEAPSDRAEWRERRAEKATGEARATLFTEAALEYEHAGDTRGALRTAALAVEAGDAGIAPSMVARLELETGAAMRQIEALVELTESTEDDEVRKAAYARLADIELHSRKDVDAALSWHRAILEIAPRDKRSLRFVEHTLVSAGRDEELERVFEQIALSLDGTAGGEVTGHAQLAARFRLRRASGGASWDRTADMARLAATQPVPSLWSIRSLNAHARVEKDEEAILSTTLELLERTPRPAERATLLLRASEAAAHLERVSDARTFLEQAANEDPGDVVTWGFLAEVRQEAGEKRAGAEACESLARTSAVPEHQLLAWYDAARFWLDEVGDAERAMSALEQCSEIDVSHADVFERLSKLYAERRLDAELARLLERRLDKVDDDGERIMLEVELSRALVEMGELSKAKQTLDAALERQPDHATALGAMAELCAKEGDWNGAEQAYVRLARLLSTPEEQRAIYERLGEIYAVHTVNLSRAELAYKEVLKRAPKDVPTLEKLVDVYRRQGDVARAVEAMQEIIGEVADPAVRLARLIEISQIYEHVGRDARRAEQALEAARREFPTSVVALRSMAEFYARQRQMPAMQILLDRAAGDARRAFAAGRFVTSLFEVLHAAYELRGKRDAARVVAATLAAVEGPKVRPAAGIVGGDARAIDPQLDEILVPELMSPALRALLFRAGDSLDVISPLDLRALRATPLVPGTPLGTAVGAVATVVGLGALQILVSPALGRVAIPLGSNPPTLLVGEGLMHVTNERALAFVIVRALKMILSRSSSLLRGQPQDVAVLVSALFTAFNPSFVPQGVDARHVAEVCRRLVPALPRNLDPTVGVIALEAAGALGTQSGLLGPTAAAWANRVALLAVGDPSAALDAIAWARGEEGAPTDPEPRAAWIARTAEARELMTFSVTDAYATARAHLGLDR
ncbi:Exonuclease SbcC [Labilithrix luteola]|uniref:Exonuclease SbcC n=1 Tax=Labilithrix luteola TaxID=1391654 RepID=A0A0K1Q852_9BACT|nr:hypothetical protein [Labilithrix luteola]AKV01832.1 Exonuclease SbcC [Labilithrix luteola]